MATPTPTAIRASSSKKNENIVATRIFINQVPEYDQLESCAEREVSTIVRNMHDGCGDGSRTTSYSCFCYASSTYFSSMIGAHVKTACDVDGAAQATEAVGVFSKYCQIGQTQGLPVATVAPASITATAAQSTFTSVSSLAASEQPSDSAPYSASSFSTSTLPSTPTSTSIPATSTPLPSHSMTATITVAILLPLIVIALMFAVIFFCHAQRKRHGHRVPSMSDGSTHPVELAAREKDPYYAAELPVEKYSYNVAELPAQRQVGSVAELPGHEIGFAAMSGGRSHS